MTLNVTGNEKKPYKVFSALISQQGLGNDATMTVLQNELGTTPIISNEGPGMNLFTFTSPVLTAGKTFITVGNIKLDRSAGTTPLIVCLDLYTISTSNFMVVTWDLATASPIDGSIDTCLDNTPLEIRVYD